MSVKLRCRGPLSQLSHPPCQVSRGPWYSAAPARVPPPEAPTHTCVVSAEKPRTAEETAIFADCLSVMCMCYASITGTCVVQVKTVPPRPQEQDDWGRVIVLPGAHQKALLDSLAGGGDNDGDDDDDDDDDVVAFL